MYYSSKEVLQKLGTTILEYFLNITEDKQDIYLFIDGFLFDKFIEDSNLSSDEVIESLNKVKCSTNDELVALSIVSYQVKILYDLNSISEDSYYSQLRVSYSSMRYWEQQQIISSFFYGCTGYTPDLGDADGERIWSLSKKLFKNHGNRKLKVCDFHHYKGRFVDLPMSQKIIDGSIRRILLEHINDFERLGLKPNQGGITFDYIRRNIPVKYFPKDPVKKDILYRLIFNFYNIWDGGSKDDYIRHQERTSSQKIKEKEVDKDESILVYDSELNDYDFYINKKKIDGKQIPEKYISRLRTKNIVFVRSSPNSKYWLLYDPLTFNSSQIEEILIIYRNQDILFSHLPSFIINDSKTELYSSKTCKDYKF